MRTGFVVACAQTLTCLRVPAFQFGLEIELKRSGRTHEMWRGVDQVQPELVERNEVACAGP